MKLPRIFSALCTSFIGLSLSASVIAQSGPAGTDIFVADLGKNAKGFWQLKNYNKVTTRRGYDNQPYFLPDGSGLLYTAIFLKDGGKTQADSFEYQFASKKHINLTKSDELSEYSPTMMNNGKMFSSIVVEKDGKQKLWAYPWKNRNRPYRLMNLAPVGYHVWGKNNDIVMFVLGEPHTLQYRRDARSKSKIVAENIGRSLRYNADRDAFSFTKSTDNKTWWLSEYTPKDNKVKALVPMPKESGYYTWINSKTAVTSVGNVLYLWSYNASGKSIVEDWLPWVDASSFCAKNISRLAVNKDSSKLAFVCDE